MIPMLRGFWRENLRGMGKIRGVLWGGVPGEKKWAPRAHARCWSCLDRLASLSARGLHLSYLFAGTGSLTCCTRDANPTIAEGFSRPTGLRRAFRGPFGCLSGPVRRRVLKHRPEALEHQNSGPALL